MRLDCNQHHHTSSPASIARQNNGKNRYYEGELDENGKAHGSGKMKYADGSEYAGQFVDGKRHSQGMIKFANKKVYEGEWMDDRRYGKGKLQIANESV